MTVALDAHRASAELGPVIADGLVRWLSATIMAKFDPTQTGGCFRRGHFQYVGGEDDEGTGSQALGQSVHKVLEGFLLGGRWEPPPVDDRAHAALALRIAMAGQRFVTPLRDDAHLGIEVSLLTREQELQIAGLAAPRNLGTLLDIDGIPIAGHSDVIRRSPFYVTPMAELRRDEPGTVEVLDWKTTKDFRWAKSGPALLDTVQMILYGEFAARRHQARNVRLSHTYLRTKGAADAMKSTTCVPREDIARRWERVEQLGRNIVDVARVAKGRSNEVDGNPGACRAFNRLCPFADRCDINRNRTLSDLLGGTMSESLLDAIDPKPAASVTLDMSSALDALLTEETAAKAAASPAPAAAAIPQPALDPALVDAIKYLKSCSMGFPPTAGAAAQAVGRVEGYGVTEGAGLSGSGKLGALPKHVQDPAMLIALAADVRKREAAQAAAATPAPAPQANPLLPPDAPASAPPAPVAAQPATVVLATPSEVTSTTTTERVGDLERTTTVTTASPAEAPKAKRGRPAKAKPVADTTAPGPVEVAAEGFELYINSVPLSGTFEYLDPYIVELCDRLCTKYECVDIRCADERTPLGFAKWKGVIAALVRASQPTPGVYVIDTDNDIKAEVAAALAPLARGGSRGTR